MGKQTMGTPCHALKYRSDNKLYRLLSPQSPIVRPKMHDYYHLDDYPLGVNAIVAVISYTVSNSMVYYNLILVGFFYVSNGSQCMF